MNVFKLEAFLKVFPFLRDILDSYVLEGRLISIRIEKATREFLDTNMATLTHLLSSNRTGLWINQYGNRVRSIPLTNLTLLEILADMADATHLVIVEMAQREKDEEPLFECIIYQPIKATNFASIVQKAREEALEQVMKEADF